MQKTDLNVTPYYDDFTEDSNFHRVLFRPAFSVQARELTQMQSILQNQIERLGSHFFKEGAMVIPGQVGFDITYSFVKVQATFTDGGTTHTVENFRTSLIGKKLEGEDSKVIAKVVGSVAAENGDDLTLYIKYETAGTAVNSTTKYVFDNDENLKTDTALSYVVNNQTRTLAINDVVAKTSASSATGTGSAAAVQKGIYYIRGTFVQCASQTVILDKYSNSPSYRVGFTITESLSTPEEDSTLLDNATGSSNYAAKGAHRLKYTLTLAKKSLGTADDADFVELLQLENGRARSQVRNTEYSVLEETLARRTFDESGDYVVRGFDIDMREHKDTGLNNGLFTDGDSSKIAITLSPGKAYVRGFEVETISQTVVALDKARSTAFIQNNPTTFSAGNYLQVENIFGMPDIDSATGIAPFKEIEIRDRRAPRTHLTGNVNNSNTTVAIPVDRKNEFPSSGNFVIRINNELMLVTAGQGTGTGNFTVTRAYLGTALGTHSDNDEVIGWNIDTQLTTNARSNVIGVARTRAFEHGVGSISTSWQFNSTTSAYPLTTRFKHYLFDVRMLCKLTLAQNLSSGSKVLHNGAKITGESSGATGFVFITKQDVVNSTVDDSTNDGSKFTVGTEFHLIQTTGTFTTGENITSNISGDLGGSAPAGGTVALHGTTAPVYFTMGDAHGLASVNSTITKSYYADIYPADAKKLTGSVNATGNEDVNGTVVSGTNTGFLSDLKVGDLVEVQGIDGIVRRVGVRSIASDTSFTTLECLPADVSGSTILRVRSKLEEQEELVMLSKLPKPAIKSLKAETLNNQIDTNLTVRRQAIITNGDSINLPEGQTFITPLNVTDFNAQVVEAGTQNIYPVGLILAPNASAGSVFTVSSNQLTVSVSGGGDMKLKVTFPVKIATANEKTKSLQPMRTLEITNQKGNIYGTNVDDVDISLNKADIFKVRAIYTSSDFSTMPLPPTITYTNGTGGTPDETFQAGETITGSNGAIGRVIDGSFSSTGTSRTASFVYLTNKTFSTTNTTITSGQQTFSRTLTVSGVTAGDTNILSSYQIDNGQRDTYYDIGRISRKPSVQAPTGRLLIVFDYFTHGSGDYFSVDSYPVGTSQTSISYDEIPLYSAQRVDPDTISPTGEYELRDSIDFRPRVGDFPVGSAYNGAGSDGGELVQTSQQLGVTSNSPFTFSTRDYTLGTSSLVDIPKTDATFDVSFDYYLPQNGALFLDSEGEFKTVVGGAAENPEPPTPIDDAMQLASFRIPQYTFDPLDVGVRKLKNRRFTMRDIGKINERVENLEYYTQLSMLEKDTKSFQIQDSDGLDRFKNGFIVDNFTGHGTGDAAHPDYKNSMDMANGILRPEFNSRAIELEEAVTTDSLRTTAGYQKTGDLISLPYTEVTMISQPYASRVENVNPFNVIAWIGSLTLDPSSDIWKDTNRLPNLIINREGNYDTFIARNGGSAINTVWNEWETFWTGETSTSEQWRDHSWATARAQVPFRRLMERTVTTTTENQLRNGIRTEITPRIDYESKGDKVVSTEILPFCRARDVNFTGVVFKPRSRLFAFFDNVDVTQYITPTPPYVNKYAGITSSIDASDTTIPANTSVFSTSGFIQIDDEIIKYDNKTPNSFTNCTRGQQGTSATSHINGSVAYSFGVMGDPLITGATGKLAGKFSIPDPNISGNPAFKVGERVLRLTSDSANGVLSGDTETSGEATYYAKGLLDNIQETIIATRNADVNRVMVNQERTVTSTRVSDRQVGWWDPLAQSIMIDVKGGAFITSVDVYFQQKSETVPAQCQIRTMANGYPTTTILPFGQASVEPSEVNVSDDASAATTFTFPSPVYLQQDIEYCFVIMANTQDYLIWLSHMGDPEVGGSRMISDQPYAGVLFKSQNASTWTAAQMEDLKFNVKRASFTTNQSGVVTLQNKQLPTATLSNNPITVIPDTAKIKVHHPNHGMYRRNNYVTIAGVPSQTINISSGTYDIAGINGTYTGISEIGIDHYILELGVDGGTALGGVKTFTDAIAYGGSAVTSQENFMMDTAKLTLQTMEVSGTNATTRIRTTSATSPSNLLGGSETSFNLTATSSAAEVAPNQNISFEFPKMVASQVNETNRLSGAKSFEALMTFETTEENLSPILDAQRMGLICIQNRMNNIQASTDLYQQAILDATNTDGSKPFLGEYFPSTAAEGDNNSAIYCTRKVTLENASTALKVIFDAIVFSTSFIDVYYKTLRSDDTTQFEDIAWRAMPIDKAITESKNYTDYREYAYEQSNLDGFIAFAIKIVMRGTNSAEPPLLKDFRAIALAL